MSWMILPCLFVYLFVGVVIAAAADNHHGYDTDTRSVGLAILWPIFIVAAVIVLLQFLIKKVRTFL